ncbi:MAG: glutamate--tRNA ligase, partial [Deltaproteobacteria bacterium]|nr:glutamate--tRNA ligase [Deltaproteobacteria bacterium]
LDEKGKKHLKPLLEKFQALSRWNEEEIKQSFAAAQQELGIQKMLDLAQPLRTALTGTTVSPGIFEVLVILGKERVLKRLGKALV